MPFELRPYPNPTLRPDEEYLQQAWSQSVYPLAARMGLSIKLPSVSPQPYTHLAFEGFQFAKQHGKDNEYNHRVLQAFFQEDQDIGQIDVLARLAGEIGLDGEQFRESLDNRTYRAAHQQALQHAYKTGITAVPTFIIGRHVLPGVQSSQKLEEAIQSATAAGNA